MGGHGKSWRGRGENAVNTVLIYEILTNIKNKAEDMNSKGVLVGYGQYGGSLWRETRSSYIIVCMYELSKKRIV